MALGDDQVLPAILADYTTAPITAQLKAALGLIQKLVDTPREVTAADVVPLRDAGLSREEIEDAIHVCGVFSIINRLADSFGWYVGKQETFVLSAKFLLKMGYDPKEKKRRARR